MDEVGSSNLKLIEEEIPTPSSNEVLIRVKAVSLNFRDIMVMEKGLDFPGEDFTPCSDMCGEVVEVGDNVARFSAGDRVISVSLPGWNDGENFSPSGATETMGHLGAQYQGVMSDYVVLHQDWVVSAPETLTDSQASTLPIAGLTAWFALVERGRMRAGETVLVHGTGGVAMWGAQIARAHGGDVLIVSRSNEKLSRARELGFEKLINREEGDWIESARNLTGGRGVDHILETIGGSHLGKSLEAAAESGRISMIGLFEGIEFSGLFPHLIRKHLKIEGIGIGHRRGLEDMVRAVDTNGIVPVIDREFDFEAFPAAIAALGQGAFGKLVVQTQ